MMANRSYVAVHDDSRLISTNEAEFRLARNRSDGREAAQHRPVQLQLTRTAGVATAMVQFGSTRTTAHVTAQLVAPSEDRPNEGWTSISVELSPMASTSYRAAAPLSTGGADGGGPSSLPSMDRTQRFQTNPILRAIERCWDAALDTEALCVLPGQFVWKLSGAITVLQDDGNCLDAAVLASIAALRHYRQPVVDANSSPPVIQTAKEPIPLPLHVTPLSMTFGVLARPNGQLTFWVDPTSREELCCVTTLSLALTIHGQLCWWTYAGHEIHMHELRNCHDIAAELLPELSQHIQQALETADERAIEASVQQMDALPPPPPNVPFLVEAPEAPEEIVAPTQEQEEEYRKRALDYNLGHITAKVRDNESTPRRSDNRQLLEALLQSVAAVSATDDPSPKADTETTTSLMEVDTVSDVKNHLPEAEEGRGLVQQEKETKPARPRAAAVALDSDEEETTVQLKSEFAPMSDEQELDLSAAIKKGKKKKKKR